MKKRPERLVFIDETGTTTKMTRLRGRARRGQRLRMKAPFGHWGTQTFIAALRHDGLTAPWVIDTPMNRQIFEAYVETQLAPTLLRADDKDGLVFPNAEGERMSDMTISKIMRDSWASSGEPPRATPSVVKRFSDPVTTGSTERSWRESQV